MNTTAPGATDALPDDSDLHMVSPRAYRRGDTFYVKSSTHTGLIYEVTGGACSCPGFGYRQTCNHVTHLEKMGYLRYDAANGGGWRVVHDRVAESGMHRGQRVTTGQRYSMAGASAEVEARDAQIRRLQDVALRQDAVIASQRRLIATLLHGIAVPSVSVVRHIKMAEVATAQLEEALDALVDGDLVELSEGS